MFIECGRLSSRFPLSHELAGIRSAAGPCLLWLLDHPADAEGRLALDGVFDLVESERLLVAEAECHLLRRHIGTDRSGLDPRERCQGRTGLCSTRTRSGHA